MAKTIEQGLAQSIYTTRREGVYLTSIDLYFSEKDSTLPVFLEMRPMENGVPSSEFIFPNSTVTVPAASITTSSDASAATKFTFPEPIYLLGDYEYAFVVYSQSKKHKLFVSKIGEFVLGSTETRITSQPYSGSLFLSQNLSTWTADQNKDLKFDAYMASFRSSTNTFATLHNSSVAVELLPVDPFEIESDGSTVTVTHNDHGFQVNDEVTIASSGAFDSSSTLGGINGASILGTRTITAVDFTGYQFEADSASSFREIGGGNNVTATRNILFDSFFLNVNSLVPNGTSIDYQAKFTSGKSFAGSETPYSKDTSFVDIANLRASRISTPKVIANSSIEASELGSGVYSFDIKANYTGQLAVAPYIDLQTTNLQTQRNIIDRQDSAATVGFNVPLNFVAETTPRDGSAAAKHVTSTVNLAEDAVGLKIFLAANRPPDADFQVYYKIGVDDTNFETTNWTLVEPETNLAPDDDPTVFREYEYLAGGEGGNLPAFTKFKLKIVMRSKNQAKPPLFRDMRVIALGV